MFKICYVFYGFDMYNSSVFDIFKLLSKRTITYYVLWKWNRRISCILEEISEKIITTYFQNGSNMLQNSTKYDTIYYLAVKFTKLDKGGAFTISALWRDLVSWYKRPLSSMQWTVEPIDIWLWFASYTRRSTEFAHLSL